MEVHVTPETANKLNDLAAASGRAPEEIVEDALAGYLDHVTSVRETLDSRYDDLKSGRVKPIDGETFFETLRQREEDLRIVAEDHLGQRTRCHSVARRSKTVPQPN